MSLHWVSVPPRGQPPNATFFGGGLSTGLVPVTLPIVASVPHSADAPVTLALAVCIQPRGVVSELIHQATRIRRSAVIKAGEGLA